MSLLESNMPLDPHIKQWIGEHFLGRVKQVEQSEREFTFDSGIPTPSWRDTVGIIPVLGLFIAYGIFYCLEEKLPSFFLRRKPLDYWKDS